MLNLSIIHKAIAWVASRNPNSDALATQSMRWARPVFFVLMTVLFVYGWMRPEELSAYFDAMAKVPEWLSNVFTILILGLAVEKGIARPIESVVKSVHGK